MHARVTMSHGDPGSVQDAIDHVRNNSMPAIRQMQGFNGILYLVDRGSGRGIAVTLWDTEDAMRQSAEAAKQVRSQAVAAAAGDVDSVDEYEVVLQELK